MTILAMESLDEGGVGCGNDCMIIYHDVYYCLDALGLLLLLNSVEHILWRGLVAGLFVAAREVI